MDEAASEAANGAETGSERTPRLRVVRGDPDPEELAALTAVITARAQTRAQAAARQATGPRQPSSRWADRSRQLRRPLPRGTDAWRAAAR